MKVGLLLMENVPKSIAERVSIPSGLPVAISAAHKAFIKKYW